MKAVLIGLMLTLLAGGTVVAQSGKVVLLLEKEEGVQVRLTMDELRNSDSVETLSTTTPYSNGLIEFNGVPLSGLLAQYGMANKGIEAAGLDDYEIGLPADFVDKALIAFGMNGEPIPRDTRGPLWIVANFDEMDPATLNVQQHFAVWHLYKLTVVE